MKPIKLSIAMFFMVFIILSLTQLSSAEQIELQGEVGGYVELSYDFMCGSGIGDIGLHYDYRSWRVGLQMKTYISEYVIKEFVPAGVPESQFFRQYISKSVSENITLTLSSHCNHYFSQSGISHWVDDSNLTLSIKYQF